MSARTGAGMPVGAAGRIAGVDLIAARGRYDVIDPAGGARLASVGSAGAVDVARAAATAEAAGRVWAETDGQDRASALRALADDLRADAGPLARTITAETGKRLGEAVAEVDLSARYLDWFATLAAAPAEASPAGPAARVRSVPAGVAVGITTWNFPLSIPVRKLAAALAAGCSMVLKPSPLAPVTADDLVRRCERHLPPGTVALVLGGPEQARALVDADPVRAVSFTGSTRAGVELAGRLAGRLTRSVLELGGRAPAIVMPGADVEEAVETIMVAKFRNNGASCIAANNVFVHRDLARPVLAALEERVRALVPADPLRDQPSTLGPMRTPSHARDIEDLAAEAAARGCRVVRGRPAAAGASDCFTPAVLVHADRPTIGWAREVFGPLLQVREYRDEDAVVAAVNRWRRGLGGYVVGADPDRATALARRLRIGIVGVGTGTPNSPELPFGGFELAGWGREGSVLGLDPFVERQTIAYGP